MGIRTVTGLILLLLAAHTAQAGTTTLFGQGCGGDLVDSSGTLPAVLTGSASAACVVGGTTTGSSSESGLAGPGILGATTETLHNGPGTAFRSSMLAQFSDTVVFTSPTNDPVNVQLLVVVKGLLTADAGTGYAVDLASNLGHLAGYNSSCSCGIGFPPLDGVARIVVSAPVAVSVNTPVPFDLTLQLDVGAGGSPDHIALDLANGVTLNPGAVFLLPPGVTVNSPGLNIVNNQWIPPSPGGSVTYINTTLTSLPPLPSAIAGDLTITGNLNLTAIDATPVTSVAGSVVVTGNGDAPVTVGSPTVGGGITLIGGAGSISVGSPSTTGSLNITTGAGTVSLGSPSTSGNLNITTGAGTVSLGSPSTSGNLSISTGSGTVSLGSPSTSGNVNISTGSGNVSIGPAASVGGNLTLTGGSGSVDVSGATVTGNTSITTTGSPLVTARTGGGTTTITMTTGVATMIAELPAGAFTAPVAFSIAPVDPAAMPGTGAAPGGGALTLSTLAAYQFTFAVPTLNAAATLDFGVPLAALPAAVQSDMLLALAVGRLTLATQGDAPGSVYQTFAVCPAGTPPAVNGCVEVTPLDAAGQPIPPGSLTVPTIIAFSGVVGHFSRWGVVIAKDDQAPVIAGVPASISVVTAGTSVVVTYATPTANDAVDGPVPVTCAPASGSSFPVGANAVTCTAKDAAGNTASAGFTITVVQDAAPPAIVVTTPAANATYAQGAVVAAAYACTDALSAVALCAGPVAVGGNVDTAAPGPHAFTVNAQDSLGNATSATVSYTVAAPATGPDLVVSALVLSTARLQRGHDVRVDVTTRNQGTARSRESSTRFYLATGPVRTPQSLLLKERQEVPPLAPGAAARWTDSVEIGDRIPPGTYFVIACADDRGEVAESDETNNCRPSAAPLEVTR